MPIHTRPDYKARTRRTSTATSKTFRAAKVRAPCRCSRAVRPAPETTGPESLLLVPFQRGAKCGLRGLATRGLFLVSDKNEQGHSRDVPEVFADGLTVRDQMLGV